MICLVKFLVLSGVIAATDRLLQLVIIIEASTPSAQMVIISLNALGFQKLASQTAYMYVFQYLSCIATITIVATCALRIIYPTS